jgi:hypothetical protein
MVSQVSDSPTLVKPSFKALDSIRKPINSEEKNTLVFGHKALDS